MLDCFLSFFPPFLLYSFLFICWGLWVQVRRIFTHKKWLSYKAFKIHNEYVVGFQKQSHWYKKTEKSENKRATYCSRIQNICMTAWSKMTCGVARLCKQSLPLPPWYGVFIFLLKLWINITRLKKISSLL